ncbi:MAG: hypothetical protein AB7O62_16665 [Pirellulales bacterium]
MATEENVSGQQPIPAAKRKMLQAWYESGSKSSAKGDWDYANDMFGRCVNGDPGNRLYAQSFLGNLQKKYNNDKKGSKLAGLKGMGASGSLKKANMQKNWAGVIEAGTKLLELNPWDTGTLASMAAACENLGHEEAQVVWLSGALEADIKEPEINRLLGRALGNQAQFDRAIICWQRVLQAKPQDEEARRQTADLTVKKTIHTGGYEDAKSSTDVMANKEHQNERMGTGGTKLTPEQQAEKAIAKAPTEIAKYIDLADLHRNAERFAEEEKVLERALQASGGGDLNIRDRIDDVQIRLQKQQLEIAFQRYKSEKTPEAEALVQKMKLELNNRELEIYRGRSERNPTNGAFKYELGLRLQRAGKFDEAIKSLQDARTDVRRKGQVLLAMGNCFLKLGHDSLAMKQYELAVEELTERDLEYKKEALYMAGRVAASKMKDYEKAEKFLTELAGMDFGFKDVSSLLDKVRKMRNKG